MSAKVYQFKPRNKSQAEITEDLSNARIFQDVQEDVLGEWQRAATRDQLNEYISSKLPSKLKITNYEDLNTIAKIEQKLGMKVASFYPGTTAANQAGWMAVFHRGSEAFSTPQMASEAMCRSMNIVLCVSFEKTLKTLGRS